MALGPGVLQRAVEQHAPTPRLRNGGSTVSGPSIRAGVSPMQIGSWRTEPTSNVPIRAERQVEQMIDMLAQVGAQHKTARPEGAFMQALDRLRVLWCFGQDGDVKFCS